ncbi:hypothetical protein [uncultured Bdellovibrio sp.]|uniref:hypothetical protein n=1 Tax=Bdellovibrio sp. HCB-162 TaxID=3394234 RepID=UPI0025F5A2E7|nr:hypothetical protein [uncultured Bdellovibrio sp.]
MKFIPIYEALTIKAQKNSPPHIAFEEVLESERVANEWARIEKITPRNLAAEKSTAPLYSQKVELPEMVLKKNVEKVVAEATYASNPQPSGEQSEVAAQDNSWMEQLPRAQAIRLQEAQRRSEVLAENWQGQTWSEMAKDVLEKSGALTSPSAASPNGVYVAGTSASGQKNTDLPRTQVYYNHENKSVPSQAPSGGNPNTSPADEGQGFLPSNALVEERGTGSRSIVGPLEITGGLAVTNEHHIEVRRSDEGILKELGRVDLQQGLYNIDVEDTSGTIVARLVDKDGKTLGEGSFRLNRLVASQTKSLQGPKLRIEPHPDFAGIVTSAYNPKANDAAPAQTRVTFVKGASEVAVKKDGYVAMDNVTKGSSTVMRAAAPKHLQTASIVISGAEFKSQLYPESMIQALQDIVAQQRTQSFDGAPTVIWGRVSQDGKNLSGIEVAVESDESLLPIYFNQFMLPDPNLKATSDNGLYAFVDVSPGFHSLLATRANSILGYQNVLVEDGSVAQGDIESTIKTEAVPLRVYDAFTGEARSALVTMQSLNEDLQVQDGVATVNLPHISRLGMMRIQPEGADYVAARYLYNDSDAFIHAPLVHWSWLNTIKTYLRIDDPASAGVIVGFVPDEDFEVYLAAYDNFEPRHIVYFDMQGRILQNRKGIAGGGFILYNVPEDTHEVVVVGSRTQKIYSRVLPVDANSLSVLTFRE